MRDREAICDSNHGACLTAELIRSMDEEYTMMVESAENEGLAIVVRRVQFGTGDRVTPEGQDTCKCSTIRVSQNEI